MTKRIVCAGVGVVGIEVACLLKRALPHEHVTVITKDKYHPLDAHLAELISGKTRMHELHVNLEQLFAQRGIEVIVGEITHIDAHTIYVGEVHVKYDVLLLDIARTTDPQGLPGVDRAHGVTDARAYLELRQQVVASLLRARASDHSQHKTFVIAGAGVTGIEVASELRTLLDHACEHHCLFPDELDVVLVEHGVQPLPKRAHEKLKGVLERRGIEYYADRVQSFTQEGVVLADRTIEAGTLIWTLTRGKLTSLGVQLDDLGDPKLEETLQTSEPHIFYVLDRGAVPRASKLDATLQLTLAQNMIAFVKGKPLRKYLPPNRPYIVTTGEGKALLVWSILSWHGRVPYAIRRWLSKQAELDARNR